MALRIDKTSRRVGFHKLSIPKAPKVKLISGMMGPIKKPKMPKLGVSKPYGF